MTTPQDLLAIRDIQQKWKASADVAITDVSLRPNEMQLLMNYIDELERRVPQDMDQAVAAIRHHVAETATHCIERIRHAATTVATSTPQNAALYLSGMADGLDEYFQVETSPSLPFLLKMQRSLVAQLRVLSMTFLYNSEHGERDFQTIRRAAALLEPAL